MSLDPKTRAIAANLIRAGVKYIDAKGWNHTGTLGANGEVCAVASIVYAAKDSGFKPTSSIVQIAVEALNKAAGKLKPSELAPFDPALNLSNIARFNEAQNRNVTEVKNFMGHVANELAGFKKKGKVSV